MVCGPTPYGYRRIGGDVSLSMQRRGETRTGTGEHGSDLLPEPSERMVVEQMRAARAEGMTLLSIAELLNELKIPRKRGGAKWYPATVKKILDNDIRLPEDRERLT